MSTQRLAYTLLALAALFWLSVQLAYAFGIRINYTPSLPLGLWRIEPVKAPLRPGQIVSFCPPDSELMRTARERGIIRHGKCPGGYRPMLKQIAALEGSRVVVGDDGVEVDGQAREGALQGTLISEMRTLPRAAYLLQPGQFWAHSLHPRSFDSRYFGPVATTAILSTATLLYSIQQ